MYNEVHETVHYIAAHKQKKLHQISANAYYICTHLALQTNHDLFYNAIQHLYKCLFVDYLLQ